VRTDNEAWMSSGFAVTTSSGGPLGPTSCTWSPARRLAAALWFVGTLEEEQMAVKADNSERSSSPEAVARIEATRAFGRR
jgi:hypothetical protein